MEKDPREKWPQWAREHWDITTIEKWKPIIIHHALAMRVLCVATTRVEGCWCAYCDAVPGMNHDEEREDVLKNGDILRENMARALFPGFEEIPYAD